MPKENVNDCAIDSQRAEVSWAPDKYVQLATVNADSAFRFPGRTEGDRTEEGEPFDGWYVTLNREGCNRLIRSLRRARDAAFGADA